MLKTKLYIEMEFKRGTIIKVEGLPYKILHDVKVEGNEKNWQAIDESHKV